MDVVTGAVEVVEAFVDDVEAVITDESEFIIVDEIVSRFEKLSGAILNRDSKSKISGVGTWKTGFPGPYHGSSQSKVKVFGYI